MAREYNPNMESNETPDQIKNYIKRVIFRISPIYMEKTDVSKETFALEDLFDNESFDIKTRERIWNYISSSFSLTSVDELKTIGSSHEELDGNKENFLNFLTEILRETGTDGFVNIERNDYITQPPFNFPFDLDISEKQTPPTNHKDLARMLAQILGYLLSTDLDTTNPKNIEES